MKEKPHIPIPLRRVLSSDAPIKHQELAIKAYHVGVEHGQKYIQYRIQELLGIDELIEETIEREVGHENE